MLYIYVICIYKSIIYNIYIILSYRPVWRSTKAEHSGPLHRTHPRQSLCSQNIAHTEKAWKCIPKTPQEGAPRKLNATDTTHSTHPCPLHFFAEHCRQCGIEFQKAPSEAAPRKLNTMDLLHSTHLRQSIQKKASQSQTHFTLLCSLQPKCQIASDYSKEIGRLRKRIWPNCKVSPWRIFEQVALLGMASSTFT